MSREKLANLRSRIRNRELGYYVKRLFPGGNIFLYGGVQLIFRLADVQKFEELFEIVSRRFGHEFRRADATDIERLCAEFPAEADVFRRRMRRGNCCYLSLKGEEITGFLWAREAEGECFDTNTLWIFRPDQMDGLWGIYAYVKPKYRLQGLFLFLMGNARRDFLPKGYDRMYGETNGGNKASIQTHLSAGYETVWKVVYVSILGLKLYFARNLKTGRRSFSYRYALRVAEYRL